jgi:hypothetical protein
LPIDELNDLAAHAFGDLERGDREIQLVHAAADELNQKPEKKAADERDLTPDIQVILRSVLIEVANFRANGARVKGRATKRIEVWDKAGGGWPASLKSLGFGDAVINSRADAASLAKRSRQPR